MDLRLPGRVVRVLTGLPVVLAAIFVHAGSPVVMAKAPPHATTVVPVEAQTAPHSGDRVASIPAGTEVELTGDVEPGVLAIYYDGEIVWVPAQLLTLGSVPGIDTAVAVQDTALREAPQPDAEALKTVPEGEAVILTGARAGDYLAGSYDGTGGWLDRTDLTR